MRELQPLLLCLVLGSCLSQNPPPVIHYFHPALPAATQGDSTQVPQPLNLGRISAAAYLHEEMVWRISEVELGFDDLNRWVEDPALLLKEALEQVLYQESGFHYSTAVNALSAEFHLRRFEERPVPDGEVCVQLFLTVQRYAETTRNRDEVHVHVPMEGDGPDAAAMAMGSALHQAAQEVAGYLRGG